MGTVSVDIRPDEEGYLGRECPECEKYFKIKPGTGLPDSTDCYCPYCQCFGSQDEFWTKQQIEYAHSVVLNQVSDELFKSMKKMERKPNRNQLISIGITVKGKPSPITYYTEKELEEKLTCTNCTLEYTIYGAFGFCPDCATHNSQQIIEANFDLVQKILNLAQEAAPDIKSKLIENALEDCISAFDGFAREHCSNLYAKLSFQNISNARDKLYNEHAIDISANLENTEWSFVVNQFQKRHLLAHKMGVVDEEFVKKTRTDHGDIGKKVSITKNDVTNLIYHLKVIVNNITKNIQRS